MTYTKQTWVDGPLATYPTATPITADRLNYLENGVAALSVIKQTKVASYVLLPADVNSEMEMNVAAANTVTVNAAFLSASASGDMLVRQYGTGTTTIVAGAGTTPLSRGGVMVLAGRYGRALITVRSATEFYLDGDLI